MIRRFSAVVVLVIVSLPAARAAESLLQNGDYVAVVGDSITEQKQYSVFIEDYLLMCQPAADLRQTQFGWSGETLLGIRRPNGQRHAALPSDGRSPPASA